MVGKVYLQSRTQHGGSLVKRGTEVLATTDADGGFAFARPVGPGEIVQLDASHPGFLGATKRMTVPGTLVTDLGAVTLRAGDVIGRQVLAARAAGCPGSATVAMPGPSDGVVNILDMNFVAFWFGTMEGSASWEPSPDGCHPEWIGYRADINGDGRVTVSDVAIVGNNLSLTDPQVW